MLGEPKEYSQAVGALIDCRYHCFEKSGSLGKKSARTELPNIAKSDVPIKRTQRYWGCTHMSKCPRTVSEFSVSQEWVDSKLCHHVFAKKKSRSFKKERLFE